MMDIIVQRPVELTMMEGDVEVVPERPKRTALLGVAGLRLLALPRRVAEGRPPVLRPDFKSLPAWPHELLHQDGRGVLLHCLNLQCKAQVLNVRSIFDVSGKVSILT